MILLTLNGEKNSKILQSQIKLVKEFIPDIIEVDLAEDYDFSGKTVINIGNHQYAGSLVLNAARDRLKHCERLIAVMDDYTSPPASQLYNAVRGKDNIIISSVLNLLEFKTGRMYNWARQSHYLNLNMLSWDPRALVQPTEEGLVYYGSFRKGREEYFEKYLGLEALAFYDITVSASHRAMKKFIELNCVLNDEPRSKDLIGFLQQYEFSIYLEDKFSHDCYCSPANRFYECVSAGIPLAFDSSCADTFQEAGITIEDFVVDHPGIIKSKLGEDTAHKQRSRWAKDYQGIIREDFSKILKEIL